MGTALVVTVVALGGAFLALGGLGDGGPSVGGQHRNHAIAQNGAIAFNVREGNAWHVGTVNPDGTDRVILTHSDPGDYAPAWSPDGTKIAYGTDFVERSSGRFSTKGTWVMNADGSGQQQLTTGLDLVPHWSPDGARIAFSRYGTGREPADRPAAYPGLALWTVNADGTGERQLTDGTFVDSSGSWSQDGRMISFLRVPIDGGGAGIWVVNADGTGAREVTAIGDVVDGSPSWSPDGTQIVYSRDGVVAGNSAPRIWVVNVDGTDDHMVLDEWGTDPTWSPDGSQIAYSGNGDIWIVDAQGANPQQITSDPDEEILPSWGVNQAVGSAAQKIPYVEDQ